MVVALILIRQYARCRSVGAAIAASSRARAASVARRIDDMDAKKKIVTVSKPGRSHRAEDWPWARDSINHVSPAKPTAQNPSSANRDARVLTRQRDDQKSSEIGRGLPLPVALSGPVRFCSTAATISRDRADASRRLRPRRCPHTKPSPVQTGLGHKPGLPLESSSEDRAGLCASTSSPSTLSERPASSTAGGSLTWRSSCREVNSSAPSSTTTSRSSSGSITRSRRRTTRGTRSSGCTCEHRAGSAPARSTAARQRSGPSVRAQQREVG